MGLKFGLCFQMWIAYDFKLVLALKGQKIKHTLTTKHWLKLIRQQLLHREHSINIKSVFKTQPFITQPTKTQLHGFETQPFINIHYATT